MSYKLSLNAPAGRDNRPPSPELKDDGTNFMWRMFFDQNRYIIDADFPDECLDQLIDGYLLAAPDEKYQLRVELARAVQMSARTTILAGVNEDDVAEWEWDVLAYEAPLHATDSDPYGWGDGSGQLGVHTSTVSDVWASEVPLVLLETSYDPFTAISRPVSTEGDYLFVKNLIWLEPSNEEDFLRSLSRVGFITFGEPRTDR